MGETDHKRVTAYFSGNVQGVGFRYNARAVGADLAVAGYVKNLEDGRVFLVAEGRVEELVMLIERIEKRMMGFIKSREVNYFAATGEFGPAMLDAFVVRH
jgi:acylphosphatase